MILSNQNDGFFQANVKLIVRKIEFETTIGGKDKFRQVLSKAIEVDWEQVEILNIEYEPAVSITYQVTGDAKVMRAHTELMISNQNESEFKSTFSFIYEASYPVMRKDIPDDGVQTRTYMIVNFCSVLDDSSQLIKSLNLKSDEE